MSAVRRIHIDRAAVVATAVLQIVASAPEQQRRGQVEAYLRDEFATLTREVIGTRNKQEGGPHGDRTQEDFD